MGDYYLIGKGKRQISFRLPESWNVVKNAEPRGGGAKRPIPELVIEAVSAPVGTPPLSELVKGKEKIAILVDDATRPTPRKIVLGTLLDYLNAQGVENRQIDVVIAAGTHNAMTQAQIEADLGEELCRSVRVTCHDSESADLVSMGSLPFAGEFKINRIAAEADFRIAVGSILPHPWNGFGGGAKLLFPGISNYQTVRRHHLGLMVSKGVRFGNVDGNPFHDDVTAAGRLGNLDFIIDSLYDAAEEVVAVVAGHFEEAYRHGAVLCSRSLGVEFTEAADITITSTFPYDKGPQMMKPVGPATMVTKKGGTVIVYADSIFGGGFSASMLAAFSGAHSLCASMCGGDTRKTALDFLRRGELIAPQACLDENHGIYNILLYMDRVKLILVSKDADAEQAAKLGFGYASTIEEAVEQVAAQHPVATVNVLPAGGLVLPLVTDDMKFEF